MATQWTFEMLQDERLNQMFKDLLDPTIEDPLTRAAQDEVWAEMDKMLGKKWRKVAGIPYQRPSAQP